MKKPLLLICMMLCCSLGWAQKNIVWENPSQFNENIGYWSNITKVELKSDETILHFETAFGGGITYAKETRLITPDGKTYKIKNGNPTTKEERTLNLTEWFIIEDNEPAKYALHFEPVPFDTKRFDLMEAENINQGFRVWGIQKERTPRVLPDYWKDVKYAENETLPEFKVEKKNATIKVKVLGYQPGITLPLHVEKFMRLMDEDYYDKDFFFNAETGECVAEIPIAMPHLAQIRIDRIATTKIVLVPGETVEILMDMYEAGDKLLAFKGFLAKTNMELYSKAKDINNAFDEKAMESAVKCTTSTERMNTIWGMLDTQKEKINAIDITDASKAILRMEAEELTINATNGFVNYYIVRHLMRSGEVEQSQEGFNAAIKKYDYMLPSSESSAFIHDKMLTAECVNANYAPYSIDFEKNYGHVESETSTSLNSDIYRTKLTINGELDMFIGMGVLSPELGVIHDPVCKEIVEETKAAKEEQKKLFASMDNVYEHTMDVVAPEEFIPTLLKKYEGKAIVFDVWATWCGPCLKAHNMMASVKEELKDKNVVFVNLALPSSQTDKWRKMIIEIPGEHYLINENQTNYLNKAWEIEGIPTYTIYNPKGEQAQIIKGFRDPDFMKTEILKALGE